jgi:hypothetical protein
MCIDVRRILGRAHFFGLVRIVAGVTIAAAAPQTTLFSVGYFASQLPS